MARSVGTHRNAVVTVYMPFDGEDYFDWTEFIDDLQSIIGERFKSFYNEDDWADREGLIILRNGHADVVVYEYCGLVSVNLVPRETYDFPNEDNLARAWCHRVADSFRELLHRCYECYYLVGRFSNGEAVYKRIEV